MAKKRTKNTLVLTVSVLTIAVLAGAFVMHHVRKSNTFTQTVDSLTVSYGYPITSKLQEMMDSADYIVIGEYTKFDSTWNMARNPNNIKEEDPENYVEGRLYDFTVEQCVKGSIEDSSILINHRYSEVITTTESNAVIDRTNAFTQQIQASDSKERTVTIDLGGVSVTDEITGKASEDIIRMIEAGTVN